MSDTDTHKEAMQKLQAEQKAKVKEAKSIDRGLVLVHTGDGKGKSSSAFGVVARALGWGHKVAVVQFIKGTWKTGEREFFKRFPDQLDWHTMGEGFTWNTQDKDRDIEAATAAFATATKLMNSGDYDLLVLDEINIALRYDYLDISTVTSAILTRSKRTSVIATGRDAKKELMEIADLVSEMKEIKHPFKAGIKAKQGIDY
ncbi:MAG: cob(I)yrinic acid a,c-diamide adenosyltransferase [Granulosicoccus sp.]